MQRLSYFGFVILGLTGTIHGMALPFLIEDYALTLSVAGLLLFLNSAGYLLASIAFPFLQRRIDAKRLLFGAFLVMLISYSIFPLFSWWSMLLCLAFLASLGTGTVDVGFNTLISSLEPEIAQPTLNWLHFSYGIGALFGPLFLSRLLNLGFSWKSFYVSAAILSFWFLLLWSKQVKESSHERTALTNQNKQGIVYREPIFWLLLIAIFIYVAAEVALVGWIPTYLTGLGVSTGNASLGISVLWLGITSGRAASSRLVQVINPKTLLLILICGASIGMWGLIFATHIWLIFAVLFIIGLFLSAIFPLIMLQGAALFRREVAQTASGLVVAGSFGAMIGPALLGFIGQHHSLQLGIIILAGLLFSSTFMIALVPQAPQSETGLAPGSKRGAKETTRL